MHNPTSSPHLNNPILSSSIFPHHDLLNYLALRYLSSVLLTLFSRNAGMKSKRSKEFTVRRILYDDAFFGAALLSKATVYSSAVFVDQAFSVSFSYKGKAVLFCYGTGVLEACFTAQRKHSAMTRGTVASPSTRLIKLMWRNERIGRWPVTRDDRGLPSQLEYRQEMFVEIM